MRGNLEHGQIVQRVAKDSIGAGKAYAAKSGGFCRAGGYIDEFAGDDFVRDFDLGGEHALFGNAEIAHAFGDDPLVSGTDGPEFDVGLTESL